MVRDGEQQLAATVYFGTLKQIPIFFGTEEETS
jgi:hypothetical protein